MMGCSCIQKRHSVEWNYYFEGGLNVKGCSFPGRWRLPVAFSRKVGTQSIQPTWMKIPCSYIGFKLDCTREFERNFRFVRQKFDSENCPKYLERSPESIIRSVYAKEASGLLRDLRKEIFMQKLISLCLKTKKKFTIASIQGSWLK